MAKNDTLKLPPQNTEAEGSVLGSLLIDKEAIYRVADILRSEDFYKPAHEKIYAAILELHQNHQPIDILSVTSYLKDKGALESVGGSGYLAELVNSVATSSNVAHYAKTVKEKRTLRDAIHLASGIAERAFDTPDDVGEFLDGIEQKLLAISQNSTSKNLVRMKLEEAGERMARRHQNGSGITGVPTGFSKLDQKLSGLQKSDFIVLGARPSLGKTSLALDIARNAATLGSEPVGVFSLEMSHDQIVDRIIAAESGIPLWRLRAGRLSEDIEFQMVQAALDRLSKVPIFIDDTPAPDILQLRTMARRMQVEHGLGLIIIDYLQLIKPRKDFDSSVQQITEISRSLKGLARELNVPVVALSQLSRGVEQRDVKIPRLSDLRESGAIEQDADIVMFLYRKDRDKIDLGPEEQNLAELIIAKHRNGDLGTISLRFDPDRVSFKEIDTIHDPNGF